METTAVVVARKGSVRLKSKSMLKLDNKQTLIERKIKQLKQCKRIHRVVFGSDCEIMREVAKSAGAQIVERPEYYCDESKASANEMIANMLSLFRTDIVVWAHCTNPLITPATYDKAIETFFDNLKQFDSLLSVVELKEHLWKSDKSYALNYNPFAPKHTPAKELAPLYMQDGGIFIQPYEQMRANSYFFGKKPYLFEIPKDEFLDINEMRDYLLAKALIQAYKGGGRHTRIYALFLFCRLALFVYSKRNTFNSLFDNILLLKIKSKVVSTHLYSTFTSLDSKILKQRNKILESQNRVIESTNLNHQKALNMNASASEAEPKRNSLPRRRYIEWNSFLDSYQPRNAEYVRATKWNGGEAEFIPAKAIQLNGIESKTALENLHSSPRKNADFNNPVLNKVAV